MKLIVFGEDSFTAIVLESMIRAGHEILSVFSPVYNNNIYKRLEFVCSKHKINFELIPDFKSADFLLKVQSLNPDVICICHFQKLISNEIIKIPKFGCLNLHPSLLPEYRGMSPQHWPIINGESKTGVTVHFVDDGIDTGNIITQEEIEIGESEYVFELQGRFKKIYESIFVKALDNIKNVENHIVQKHLPGSYYGRLKLSECRITDGMDVLKALNLIRGVSFPYFGARYLNFILWKAEIYSTCDNHKVRFESKDNIGYLYLKNGILRITKFEEL